MERGQLAVMDQGRGTGNSYVRDFPRKEAAGSGTVVDVRGGFGKPHIIRTYYCYCSGD